jgi:hypothetical protein
VDAKVAAAATVQEIRDLADRALRDARNTALTVAEIHELAQVAIERARKVDSLVTRLATLLDNPELGGDPA